VVRRQKRPHLDRALTSEESWESPEPAALTPCPGRPPAHGATQRIRSRQSARDCHSRRLTSAWNREPRPPIYTGFRTLPPTTGQVVTGDRYHPDVDIASIIVSIVAVLISAGSVFYARRLDQSARAIEKAASQAANAASASADAAELSAWIESDRHHRERRPRLTARIALLDDDLWQLHITLHVEDSPLSDMTVR
jgi:hypothetical protein